MSGKMAWLLLAAPLRVPAQTASPAYTPAQIVVTIGHHYGHEPPVLTRDDLAVLTPSYETLAITGLVPLRGERAGLELFVLVDNCSSCEVGTKFLELNRFIAAQPSTTAIGVGYITNGKLSVAERPTLDRRRAVRALNAPAGSTPASPFDALKDLIATWRPTSARRAVLMVTNGINPYAVAKEQDPPAESAIEAAQKAAVTLFAIYHPSADYSSTNVSRLYDGQVQLAHVAHDTGGEAYFVGFGPAPSIAPYLSDIADHLANQYMLEFAANPVAEPGVLEEVTVKPKDADIEIMAPERVWVAGPAPASQP
jgi:hypothetical protein